MKQSRLGHLGSELFTNEPLDEHIERLRIFRDEVSSSSLNEVSVNLEQTINTLVVLEEQLKNLDQAGLGIGLGVDHAFAMEEGKEGELSRTLSDLKSYLVQDYVRDLCDDLYKKGVQAADSKDCFSENFNRLMTTPMSQDFFMELYRKYGRRHGAGQHQEFLQSPDFQKTWGKLFDHAGQADELFSAQKIVLEYEISRLYVSEKPLFLAKLQGLSIKQIASHSARQLIDRYFEHEKASFKKFMSLLKESDPEELVKTFAFNPGVADFMMQLLPRQRAALCTVQKKQTLLDRGLDSLSTLSELGALALLPFSETPATALGTLGLLAVSASASNWKTARIYQRLNRAKEQSSLFGSQLSDLGKLSSINYVDAERSRAQGSAVLSSLRTVAFLSAAWVQASKLGAGLTRLDRWTRLKARQNAKFQGISMDKKVFINEGILQWSRNLPSRITKILSPADRNMLMGPLIRRGIYERITFSRWLKARDALFYGPNKRKAILPFLRRSAWEGFQIWAGPVQLFYNPREVTGWTWLLGYDLTFYGALAFSAKQLFEAGRDHYLPVLEGFLNSQPKAVDGSLILELLVDAQEREDHKLVERYEKYLQLEREGLNTEAASLLLLDREITRDFERLRDEATDKMLSQRADQLRQAGARWQELCIGLENEIRLAKERNDRYALAVLEAFQSQVYSTNLGAFFDSIKVD